MPLGEYLRMHVGSPEVYLHIYKGHYATAHSHMNYYIDITASKSSMRQAKSIAKNLAETVKYSAHVDTILCLDGTEVIGAFLAREICRPDRFNISDNTDVYVLSPELTSDGRLIFRDNTAPLLKGKDVLILAASVVSGKTAQNAIEAVQYYKGNPTEIAAVFATMQTCGGIPVRSVFDPADLPDYFYSSTAKCPMCAQGEKINALINSYGCSAL